MKLLFAVVLATLPVASSHAQLGKSAKANTYELGKPVKDGLESGFRIQIHEKNGYRYKMFYGGFYGAGDRAILVQIRHFAETQSGESLKIDFSDNEISGFLSRNADESKWIEKPAQSRPGLKHWEREDGKAVAEFTVATGVLAMGIRPAMPERVNIDPWDWTPFQLCFLESFKVPPSQSVYGLKTGFMSGGGRVVGVEGTVISAGTPEVIGLKGSLINAGDGSRGLHFGLVNIESDFKGMQFGAVNVLSGKLPGQPPPSGAQFSIVNIARDFDGVQIGLVNIIFNGSLPFMVIFNFDSPVKEAAE